VLPVWESRVRRWAFLVLGVLLSGLTWPLTLAAIQVKVDRLDLKQEPDFLESLAVAAKDHPVWAFLVWLALVTFVTYILGGPHQGPRDFKLLWGMFEQTLPDPVLKAEEKREHAERERDAAFEIVDDFAALLAWFTPLVDRRDPRLAQRVFDDVCKLSARAVTSASSSQVSIWLHDPSTNQLRIRASHRVGYRTVENFRLHPGDGLVGQVFASARPKAIPDVSKVTPAEFAEDPYSAKPRPQTAMALPLFADSHSTRVVGVICFTHRGGADPFGAEDLRDAEPYVVLASLVLTFSAQMGIPLT
jgi:hypothetical protein